MAIDLARRYVPLLLLAVIPCIVVIHALGPGEMLYGGDVVAVFHHSRRMIAETFREGALPVWESRMMAGFPLLAGVQAAVFYPPSWLCVVLPAGVFWTTSAALHMVLAGLFAHAWLRRGLGMRSESAFAGAFVFMMSGFFATHLYAGHVNHVWAYPWVPAVLWRLEMFLARSSLRRGVFLASAWAMLVLAGAPQYAFMAGLLLAARLVWQGMRSREERRDALRAAAALGLGLLACAPQILPTLELIPHIQRGTAPDEGFASRESFPPENLIMFLFPTWFGDGIHTEYRGRSSFWETSAYVGVGTLVLAVIGVSGRHRQRMFWVVAAAGGLFLALGLVPMTGFFRAPARFLLIPTLAFAALAALGVDRLAASGVRWRQGLAAALALMAAIELLAFALRYYRGQPEEKLLWPPDVARILKSLPGAPYRLASGGTTRAEIIGMSQVAGLDHVCGYEPMMLQRYAELMHAARGTRPEANIPALLSVGPHPLMDLLGVRIWVMSWAGNVPKEWKWLGMSAGERLRLYENPGALPRAWMVSHAVVVQSREERLRLLGQGLVDFRRTVVLEEVPGEAPPVPSESESKVTLLSRGRGAYRFAVENPADGYLVLSETWYPGWTAEVDGKPAEIHRANHLIQAVRIPPGRHEVKFACRSRFLPFGFTLAGAAVLVPLGILLRRSNSRKRWPGGAAGSDAPSRGGT